MKRFLLVVLCGAVIGALLSYYIFNGIDKTYALGTGTNKVTLFQVGVFSDYKNAIICSNSNPGSIIINEKNLYRVYIGLANDKEVILAYKNYFDDHNIKYYEKTTYLSDKCIDEVKKYEEIIKRSFDPETYLNINKILLKYYKEECHD